MGAAGGSTTHEVDGWSVRLALPEGAVDAPIDLQVTPLPPEPGVLFAADFTPSPYQFLKPIDVTFNECAAAGLP